MSSFHGVFNYSSSNEVSFFVLWCFSFLSTGWADWTSDYFSSDTITVLPIFFKWSTPPRRSMMRLSSRLCSQVRDRIFWDKSFSFIFRTFFSSFFLLRRILIEYLSCFLQLIQRQQRKSRSARILFLYTPTKLPPSVISVEKCSLASFDRAWSVKVSFFYFHCFLYLYSVSVICKALE